MLIYSADAPSAPPFSNRQIVAVATKSMDRMLSGHQPPTQ